MTGVQTCALPIYYQLHIEQQSALIDEALTLHAAAGGEAMAQRLQAHGS